MQQKRHNSLASAIDAGAKVCGSQNQLAKYLGTNSGNLSNVRAGKCTLSIGKLELLALLISDDPCHLWTLGQLARLKNRKPPDC